jgi:hypothetical protein
MTLTTLESFLETELPSTFVEQTLEHYKPMDFLSYAVRSDEFRTRLRSAFTTPKNHVAAAVDEARYTQFITRDLPFTVVCTDLVEQAEWDLENRSLSVRAGNCQFVISHWYSVDHPAQNNGVFYVSASLAKSSVDVDFDLILSQRLLRNTTDVEDALHHMPYYARGALRELATKLIALPVVLPPPSKYMV